ncbi:MAG: hypothetical protein WKG07_33440 [Hymenobacter sp.]
MGAKVSSTPRPRCRLVAVLELVGWVSPWQAASSASAGQCQASAC